MKATHRPKENRWMTNIRIRGKRKPVYGKTEEECLKKAEDTLKMSTPPSFALGSLAEFVYGTWWLWKSGSIRGTTQRKYNGMLVHQILPPLGHKQMHEIAWEDVKGMVRNATRVPRSKAGNKPSDLKPLSNDHKREILLLLKDIFKLWIMLGAEKGVQRTNPCDLVKSPKIASKIKKNAEPEEGVTEALIAHVQSAEPQYTLIPFLALFLGLRRGEICGFPKSAVRAKKLEVEIYTQLQPYDGDVPTKGEIRTLELPQEMIDFIQRHADETESPYLITNDGKPLSPNEVSKWVPEWCEKAGIQRMTLHQLRHLAMSNLADLGVDPFIIVDILGHTDLKTSLIYLNMRRNKARRREAIATLFRSVKVG